MVLRNTNRIETNLNNCVIFSIKWGRLERENLAVEGTGVSSVGSRVESTKDATVSDGSVARDTSVAVVNASDDSNVMGMAGGVRVVLGKAVSNLTESVGISIRVGLTLAVVVVAVASVANMTVSTVVSTVANGSVARHKSMSVVNASDHSYVVGVASGVGIVLGKTVGNLAKSVGISISLRLGLRVSFGITLAVVVSSVASVADMSISTVVSTVADCAEARHTSMSIVHSSDNPNVVGMASGIGVSLGKTVSNLAEGVGISLSLRISVGGNNGQENNGKGLHLSCVQANNP